MQPCLAHAPWELLIPAALSLLDDGSLPQRAPEHLQGENCTRNYPFAGAHSLFFLPHQAALQFHLVAYLRLKPPTKTQRVKVMQKQGADGEGPLRERTQKSYLLLYIYPF